MAAVSDFAQSRNPASQGNAIVIYQINPLYVEIAYI
jgi:hypothetical protein